MFSCVVNPELLAGGPNLAYGCVLFGLLCVCVLHYLSPFKHFMILLKY